MSEPTSTEPTPPTNEPDPEPAPADEEDVLTELQRSRIAALDVARDVLASADASPGFGRSGGKPAPAVTELLEVADYILTGVRVDFTFDDQANRSPVVFGLTGDLSEDMLAQLNALATRTADPEPAPVAAAPAPQLPPVATPSNPVAQGGVLKPQQTVVPQQTTAAEAENRPPPSAPPADPPAGSGG